MRLTCPTCETAYEVPAGQIPEDGRHVQCSACHTRWFARPEVEPDPSEDQIIYRLETRGARPASPGAAATIPEPWPVPAPDHAPAHAPNPPPTIDPPADLPEREFVWESTTPAGPVPFDPLRSPARDIPRPAPPPPRPAPQAPPVEVARVPPAEAPPPAPPPATRDVVQAPADLAPPSPPAPVEPEVETAGEPAPQAPQADVAAVPPAAAPPPPPPPATPDVEHPPANVAPPSPPAPVEREVETAREPKVEPAGEPAREPAPEVAREAAHERPAEVRRPEPRKAPEAVVGVVREPPREVPRPAALELRRAELAPPPPRPAEVLLVRASPTVPEATAATPGRQVGQHLRLDVTDAQVEAWEAQERLAPRSRFGRGVFVALVLFGAALGLYVFGGELAAMTPALAPAIEAYVGAVDRLREAMVPGDDTAFWPAVDRFLNPN